MCICLRDIFVFSPYNHISQTFIDYQADTATQTNKPARINYVDATK